MPEIEQKTPRNTGGKTLQPCPVCGAGVSAALAATPFYCRHCGFSFAPVKPAASGKKQKPLFPAKIRADLGLGGDKSIFNTAGLAINGGANKYPAAPCDVIDADGSLDACADVNLKMAELAAALNPGGLLILEVSPARFGKNSLQILLERHGFRLAGRPFKWRLASLFGTRRLLARKI